jgi:hypothetical protein
LCRNMAAEFQLLLFGDETGDFRGPLQELCENQHGTLFSRFIDDLNVLLHDEVCRQRRHVKEQIPPFTDVLDLVRKCQDSDRQSQVLKTPLLCIFQLGRVIRCASCVPVDFCKAWKLMSRIAFSTIIHRSLSRPLPPSWLAFVRGCWLLQLCPQAKARSV